MERIKLTKREKQIFKILYNKGFEGLSPDCNVPLLTLQNKGLVRAFFVEGGIAIDAYLTAKGKEYIAENPKLRNPMNMELISIIASVIAAIAALLALFLCYLIYIKIP